MEDRNKLELLGIYHELSINGANTYMWFAIPGGLMTGKAITSKEYLAIINLSTDVAHEEKHRFVFLKDVQIINAAIPHRFNVARLDLLEVVAWGLFDYSTSTFI